MNNQKATALLQVAINVDCPHCDAYLDILNGDDTGGRLHDEEGQVLSQALPGGDESWHEAHKNFSVEDVECGECGLIFDVKGLDW